MYILASVSIFNWIDGMHESGYVSYYEKFYEIQFIMKRDYNVSYSSFVNSLNVVG